MAEEAPQRSGAGRVLRVAYFPDTFHEVNGVAHTSRQFEAFAARRKLPFFCLRPGKRHSEVRYAREGEVTTLDLPRGSALSFRLETDLSFDPAFVRHLARIARALREFRPDILHITGPSEPGILGAWLAKSQRVPLAASWHTNLHEYAARRSTWLRLLPTDIVPAAERHIEEASFLACARFYSMAQLLFAPNAGLCHQLGRAAGRPCALMSRGVDTAIFSPEFRDRAPGDDTFVLGFCGRLSIEKNVSLLARIRRQLLERGVTRFRFLIVGRGKEERRLREELPNAEFPGVLHGRDLSRAYANMDLFVFPSHTDTFGNVVLEALASGVPAVVTPEGGPCTIVRPGVSGFVAADGEFADAIARLISDAALHERMRLAARHSAESASWDSVFEGVYRSYEALLATRACAREGLPSARLQ